MSNILKVDTKNPDLLKPRVFKVPTPGKYTLEVGNDLKVEPAKAPSQNQLVNIELRVLNDGEFKGTLVFDRIVLITDATTEKGAKARAINDARLSQFAVSCGVCTKEDIGSLGEIDLAAFKGRACEATLDVDTSPYQDPNTGQTVTRAKSIVKQYLFAGMDEQK